MKILSRTRRYSHRYSSSLTPNGRCDQITCWRPRHPKEQQLLSRLPCENISNPSPSGAAAETVAHSLLRRRPHSCRNDRAATAHHQMTSRCCRSVLPPPLLQKSPRDREHSAARRSAVRFAGGSEDTLTTRLVTQQRLPNSSASEE